MNVSSELNKMASGLTDSNIGSLPNLALQKEKYTVHYIRVRVAYGNSLPY